MTTYSPNITYDKPNFDPNQSKKNKQYQPQQNNPSPQQQKRDEIIYQEVAWTDTIYGLRLIYIHKFYDSNGNIWPRSRAIKADNVRGLYIVESDRPWLYKETDFQYKGLCEELDKYIKELGGVYKLAELYEEKVMKRTKNQIQNVTTHYIMPRIYKYAMVLMLLITIASIYLMTR